MEIFIKVIQFLLGFSFLIIIHELGHFMFARMFGVRVEKFQLFFGRMLFSFKRGDTVYGIGWIPFGGFVTLSGMIDESMNTEQMKEPVKPYEFRSKKAWQRLLIMSGGVIMNILLAFVIYIGISYTWGERYLSTDDMKYGYVFSDEAKALGFEDGDRIFTVNGNRIENFARLMVAVIVEQNSEITIGRGGDTIKITTPETSVMKLLESPDFMMPRYPFRVGALTEDGGAKAAGIRPGDLLVSVDGKPLRFFDEYTEEFTVHKDRTVQIGVERDSAGVTLFKVLPVKVSDGGIIGASVDILSFTPYHTHKYTLLQSFPAGFKRVGTEIGGYWKQLKLIVKPKTEAYKSIGGPLAIGNIFPGTWDWHYLWSLTALLSIILAVMNILPIPALDGGHVMFLLVEIITGRKPGDKFITYAQLLGLALLFSIMIYATWNDVHRLFIK